MVESLSLRQAQLLTLASQGLIGARPQTVLESVQRTSVLQIDSVNVFERAHYLPLFSRLGGYNKPDLDALTGGFNPALIETWSHAACFIETKDWPLYRYRMAQLRGKYLDADGSWGATNRKFLDWLLAEVAQKGALTAGEIEHDRSKRGGSWWGWSDVKRGLELLFLTGDLVSGGRRSFQRLYATPSSVLPVELIEAQVAEGEARKQLVLQAAGAFGVANFVELIDYHRLNMVPGQGRAKFTQTITELVADGQLETVQLEGVSEPQYVLPGSLERTDWASLEREAAKRTTILSPFDPIAWNRERATRLYGFDYKIEIYVPAPKRIYGYYCLPILHNGALAGRIDLKSDRKAKQLLVQAAWHETKLKPSRTAALASQLAKHLREVQAWQQLNEIVVSPNGNLAAALKPELKA
ncbi:MAG: hypothetical protein RL670_319 [Actinomycetota bacterium]